MLSTQPSFEQIALNRVTFGATDVDVAHAQAIGWNSWVAEQLAAPPGDDPAIAAHIAAQTLRITYGPPTSNEVNGTWNALDVVRPLTYLNADIPTLWNISVQAERSISPAERERVLQEVLSATWIRNVGAQWQLREFMVDFWHNHFNIGKTPSKPARSLLASYDRDTIRPNAFGNFRTLLEAVATSPAMGLFLDNATSTAVTPNENYGRELLELHTLSARVYQGANPHATADGSLGYSDFDVLQDSRALSGWTLQMGQPGPTPGARFSNNGMFVYNPLQHNTQAGLFLGVELSQISGDMAQGRKVLDLVAYNQSTALFVCTKLCRRIFGDNPDVAVINRAVGTWNSNLTSPDQIARVLRTILVAGTEIGTGPLVKIRRPYERIMALLRTTGAVVNASGDANTIFDVVNDALFAWATPDGRPDANSYWLSTGATLTAWNLAQQIIAKPSITTSIVNQTPAASLASATGVVEYWVGRMVGYALGSDAMNGLISDQAGRLGLPAAAAGTDPAKAEAAGQRLVALISMTDEFSHR